MSSGIAAGFFGCLWYRHASSPPAKTDVAPPEREQPFGGGGADLLSLICPELDVAPLSDPGTDLEDELPSPDTSPVVIGHGVALLPAQVEEYVDLTQVLAAFGTLPAIVTPIRDPQEERVGLFVTSAGPTVVPSNVTKPPTGSVGCSPMPLTTPAVPAQEENLLFQGQPWFGPSSGGEPADNRLPAAPLTSRPVTASHHDGKLYAVRELVNVPDLSREGLFDIHQGHHHSGTSPRLRQDTLGCPFRMTSYDAEKGGPDFSPYSVSSFMICAYWSMPAPRSRHNYLIVAQSTGSSTWEGEDPLGRVTAAA